jgi:hypothetical protein
MYSCDHDFFVCVSVMYSGEYDVSGVTLSVYPHQARLKNMPGYGGNRIRLRNTNTHTHTHTHKHTHTHTKIIIKGVGKIHPV